MERIKFQFGMLGAVCLLLIIPIKALRWTQLSAAHSVFVDVAPSLLSPAGFMFLILGSSGRLSRLTLPRLAAGMAVLALSVEFLQLLPRPGILGIVRYTFDWLDVIAIVLGVAAGYCGARMLISRKPTR